VTLSATSDVYYDPYNVELNADPNPMFRRLREEAPLYYSPTSTLRGWESMPALIC